MNLFNEKRTDVSALVAFGSETGNAQDFAEEVGRMLDRIRFPNTVRDLDAVDLVRVISRLLHPGLTIVRL